jgi:hypothetical protein
MKIRLLPACLVAFSLLPSARADGVADLARAQLLFARVMNGLQQYKQVAATAEATTADSPSAPAQPAVPEPLTDKSGKFFLPYGEDGQLAGWANKALGAQVGAAVGAKVGEKAGQAVLAKVPFGGLLAGGARKKGKELGALAAVGGSDFVKQTSKLSFNSLKDYAAYLHVNHAGDTDYVKALAAALAIYPDLEKTYEAAVKETYAAP